MSDDELPFEIVDAFGRVLYESSDPPTRCLSYWEGPCGGCDGCATMYARNEEGETIEPARPYVEWPWRAACRWCAKGRYLNGRCEFCNEPTSHGDLEWSTTNADPLAGSLMFMEPVSPYDLLVTSYLGEGLA